MYREMDVTMHPSVQKVAEFMQRNLEVNELRGVAEALHVVAPAIWGNYPKEDILPVYLLAIVSRFPNV